MRTRVKRKQERVSTALAARKESQPDTLPVRGATTIGQDIHALSRKLPSNGAPKQAQAMLNLQRAIGNRATARLVSMIPERQKLSRETDSNPHAGALRLMAKGLRGGSCGSGGGTASEEDLQENKVRIMAKAPTSGPDAAPDDLVSRLARSRGTGAPLPDRTRLFMEAKLGQEFGGVRVHTDGDALQMTAGLNARAFTSGADIYFNAGAYRPETPSGLHLLAHELTHVVQQGATGGGQNQLAPKREDDVLIQGYKLKNFPPDKERRMHSALASAETTLANCKRINRITKFILIRALKNKRYDYVPDLGLCGWTFPGSWYIEVGKEAFDPSTCCWLSSTLAHEASHTELYTEGMARKLECKCFDCCSE